MSSQSVDPIEASDTRLLARVWDWAGQAVKPIDAAEIARQAAATHPRATGLRGRLTGAQATASAVADAHRQVRSRPMFTGPRIIAVVAVVGLGTAGLFLAAGQGPSPVPTAPIATAVPSTRPSPVTISSGTTATAIGQMSWTRVQGDASNVPAGEIFATPDGLAAIESDLDGRGARFWESPDGVNWAVAPMPVPTTGWVELGQAAGEHWIVSTNDFRLWRSPDFVVWSEVDLEGLKPPAIDGVDWAFWSHGPPVTIGSTTVLRGGVSGSLALDELLGIPLAPGEMLYATNHYDPDPAPGETDIYRAPNCCSSDDEDRVRVGSIRIEQHGSIVTVTDVGRDVVVAEIDATTVGVPAVDVAQALREDLTFRIPTGDVVISDGVAHPVVLPPDPVFLDVVGDRFVAMSDGGTPTLLVSETLLVWVSTNGIDWESVGPPTFPSAGITLLDLMQRRAGDAGQPLTAAVLIDEADTQRLELWSSADGQAWLRLGLVYTYPENNLRPIQALAGGYLATGDDFRIHVSATGDDWTVVDGIEGVGRSIDEYGGTRWVSATTPAAAFVVESLLNGDRVLWVFRVDASAKP